MREAGRTDARDRLLLPRRRPARTSPMPPRSSRIRSGPSSPRNVTSATVSGKLRGGLSLARRDLLLKGGDSGSAAMPGKPKESLLVEAVEHRGELKMPPDGKLSATEIDHLRRWIEIGLPWPDAPATSPAKPATGSTGKSTDADEARAWWSFRPLRRADPPAVKDSAWPRSAIDRFILAGLEAKGLRPTPPADRRTLLRRATFDLTGLPPTPEEIDAFLADARRMRSPGSWIDCWPRRLMASDGAGTGSTSSATPTPAT